MAYNKEEIKEQMLKNIRKDMDITTFEMASDTVAPTRKTLYDWQFHKCNTIKDAIESNITKVKQFLRREWRTGNATLQLALYKLLSSDEERKALQMEYREHSGEVGLKEIRRTIVDPNDE